MEALGEYLKQGRKEAGLSLEDLAGRTRIRLENLARLEDGDLASLPTETYVRGFVRLVCKELGLPADEGIERYEMLLRSRAPTDEMVWSAEQDTVETSRLENALSDPERIVGIAKRVGFGVAALVAVVLLITGGRFVAGLVSDRGGEEIAQSEIPAEPAGSEDAGVVAADAEASRDAERADPPPAAEPDPSEELARAEEPAAKAAPPAKAPADPEPEPLRLDLAEVEVPLGEPGIQPGSGQLDPAGETDLAQAAEDTVPEETPAAAAPPVAAPRIVESTPEPEVVADSPEAAPAPRELVGTRSGSSRLELEVEALRDVEFAVLLDGVGRARRKSMQAGERRTWKAQSLFVITADDGGAIRLRLSGRDLGLAGADGEPVRGLRVRAP